MKKFTNVVLTTSFLFSVFCFSSTAQTNVSGGIYANTTWTLANSPYIVTDTVVVFPGDTLTIEPGVTVRFKNNMLLEIRGWLIALGTSADSITFTSDSLVPSAGIWQGILSINAGAIALDYCILKYSDNGLNQYDSTIIQHSSFYYNNLCISTMHIPLINKCFFYNNGVCVGENTFTCNVDSSTFINNDIAVDFESGNITNSTFIGDTLGIYFFASGNITNCIFINNQTAADGGGSFSNINLLQNSIFCNNVYAVTGPVVSVINCNFSQNHVACSNGVGTFSGNIFTDNDTAIYQEPGSSINIDSLTNNYIYHNQVGIILDYVIGNISNNYVCNNTLYNLIYVSTPNDTLPNICWCDTDSATIRSKIYDGYNNINYGIVNFTPYIHCDSSVITALPPINCQTVIVTDIEESSNHSMTGTFEIYPNPASDNITLNLSKEISKAQFKIFNMLGELKYSSVVSSQKTNVDISGLANGVYLVEVITENNILRQKFIKQQ